jgi:CubicO group peptidase (beta-lactamase class C family)
MTRMPKRLVSALLLLLLTAVAQAQTFDAKSVDRIAQHAMQTWQIPGLAIAIVENDKVVYLKAFGVKEIGTSNPVTPDTLFHIGSTTKAFTTTAMAMLADEGKLRWDDPVRKHLEYFHLGDPCADSMVTLRDIVSHRSGLDTHDELWDGVPWTTEEVIRHAGGLPLSLGFRTAYRYNNIMFATAGAVVASASKMPWTAFFRTRIFEPLGMTETRTTLDEWNAASDRATGHKVGEDEKVAVQTLVENENLGGAGLVKSSARDMARWIRFQLGDGTFEGKRLVSAEMLDATKQAQTPMPMTKSRKENYPDANLLAYGMGWFLQDHQGELLVWHTGSLNGFRAHVDLLPVRKSGFVILSNLGRSVALLSMRNSLVDILTTGKPSRDWDAYYTANEARAKETSDAADQAREAARKKETKPALDLASYAGTYTSTTHGPATVTIEAGNPVLHWQHLNVPLRHWHYDTWRARSVADDLDEMLTFALDEDGNAGSFTLWGVTFRK